MEYKNSLVFVLLILGVNSRFLMMSRSNGNKFAPYIEENEAFDPNSKMHAKHLYARSQMFNPTGLMIRKRFWKTDNHPKKSNHLYQRLNFQQPMGLMIR